MIQKAFNIKYAGTSYSVYDYSLRRACEHLMVEYDLVGNIVFEYEDVKWRASRQLTTDMIVYIFKHEDQTKSSIDDKIEHGVEYLEATHPGWFNRIDLDFLDMISTYMDIVGQLGINITTEHQCEYGMTIDDSGDLGTSLTELYKQLTEKWKLVILALRTQGVETELEVSSVPA